MKTHLNVWGMTMRQGTIVAATLIAAPSSTKNNAGHGLTRLRGMAKNRCKVNVFASLTNLFLARRQLLAAT